MKTTLAFGLLAAFVVPAGAPSWTSDPTDQIGAMFGWSAGAAGDVNGDGYPDALVAAKDYDGSGRVYVYAGSATGLPAAPTWWIAAPLPGGNFGYGAAAGGDVNGDGFDDIVVGAPYADGAGVYDSGAAFVFHGSAAGPAAAPSWTWSPATEGVGFGFSVASAGDVNADGYDDVIVGALVGEGETSVEGEAYVFLGSASGLAAAPAWTAHPADQIAAHFGYSVSSAGDVNGDGYADVVVGAKDWSGAASGEGRLYVYTGSPSGLGAAPAWIADPTNTSGAALGARVCSAGDVNGDGSDEVVATSPGESRAYVFYFTVTGPSVTPLTWVALEDCSDIDSGLASGDVNEDGFSDVIVGQPYWGSSGRAKAFYGSAGGPSTAADWTVTGTDGAFGLSVGAADVNLDGASDVIVGAPSWDGEASGEGRTYLFLGDDVPGGPPPPPPPPPGGTPPPPSGGSGGDGKDRSRVHSWCGGGAAVEGAGLALLAALGMLTLVLATKRV